MAIRHLLHNSVAAFTGVFYQNQDILIYIFFVTDVLLIMSSFHVHAFSDEDIPNHFSNGTSAVSFRCATTSGATIEKLETEIITPTLAQLDPSAYTDAVYLQVGQFSLDEYINSPEHHPSKISIIQILNFINFLWIILMTKVTNIISNIIHSNEE